jgi:hypothetical protein
MNRSINIIREFIISNKNKTLRGQQFQQPQEVKKEEAAEIKYIIYSVESCFESRLHHQLTEVSYRGFTQYDAKIVLRLGITASLHIFYNPSLMLPLATV